MSTITIADPTFEVAGVTMGVDKSKFIPQESRLKGFFFGNLDIGPQEFDALCAAGTHSERDVFELMKHKLRQFEEGVKPSQGDDELGRKVKQYISDYTYKVFRNTLARGHIDVADMATYLVVGRNVPRLVTLFLCSPHYLSHEQQSLRYTKANSFYIPSELRGKPLGEQAFGLLKEAYQLYLKMVEKGVPLEDARSVLPLAVNSNITSSGGGREYTYLAILSRSPHIILPQVVKDSIDQILKQVSSVAPQVFMDYGPNYDIRRYYPSPQLFVKTNQYLNKLIRENGSERVALLGFHDNGLKLSKSEVAEGVLSGDPAFFTNLLHIRAVFLVKLSLEAAHQAIRHRTWNHDFESLYDAAERFEYMVPPSIQSSDFLTEYHQLQAQMRELYVKMRDEVSKSESLLFLTNAHYVYDLMEIDGWNMIGNLPLRTCEKAQWEIRGIAKLMVSKLAWGSAQSGFSGDKTLSFYALPTCQTFGVCYEDNSKDVCPIYKHKFLKA
ncbi:MAG: FAD-dependent thymidylate synthase [Thermoprotei archaeon]